MFDSLLADPLEPVLPALEDASSLLGEMRQHYGMSLELTIGMVMLAAHMEGGSNVARAMHQVATSMITDQTQENESRQQRRARLRKEGRK